MSSFNTIVLTGDLGRVQRERKAGEIFKPGHMLEEYLDTTLKYRKSTNSGNGVGPMYIAMEDALRGLTVDDAFAVGDPVQCHMIEKNCEFQGRVAVGMASIPVGGKVMQDGAGGWMNFPSGGNQLHNLLANTAAVTSTSTETAFASSYTLPAYFAKAGDIYRIRFRVLATTTNSTDKLVIKVKCGSNIIFATPADFDPANSDVVTGLLDMTVRTTGNVSTGTAISEGTGHAGTPAVVAGAADEPFASGLAEFALNTQTANAFTITATWDSANAGNSCRLEMFSIDLIRAGGPIVAQAQSIDSAAVDNSAGSADKFIHLVAL